MSASGRKNYTQKFRKEWLQMKQFDKWLREVPGDSAKAFCSFCRCEIAAKYSLLTKHAETKKHITSVPFKSNPITQFMERKSDGAANVEGKLALYVCCHSSINSCDHLVDLCKNVVKDSEVVPKVRMYRSKCTAVIKNVLGPHFKEKLIADIGDGKFSLLLDESNDISVHKMLGIAIIYSSKSMKKVVHTFLSLVELSSCDADDIVESIKSELANCKLNITNLIAIGTDNASVMVGVNKGVFKKLKEEVPALILVRCVCHSLQLAMSHASAEVLPRNLEFLIAETYKWFAYSSSRQTAYCQLYKAINDNKTPLKMVNNCSTRWLSIEPAVGRVLTQWLELKTHFEIMSSKEECYTAHMLYEMYKDEKNLLYLLFLHPVLVQVQVNKIFESNNVDKTKLFADLSRLIKSIAQLLILPTSRVDPLQSNIEEYLDPQPNLGYRFERKVTELRTTNRLNHEEEMIIRNRSKAFLLNLFQQLKQRLPENMNILKQASCFSVESTLKPIKEDIKPILQVMCNSEEEIAAVEYQYNSIHLNKWINVENTERFWFEVSKFQDAAGVNPFKKLSDFAMNLLLLPNSNAEIERVFSSMNIVKNKLRNKMELPLLKNILYVKYGLKLNDKCCKDYELPASVTNMIGNMSTYNQEDQQSGSQDITCDILFEDVDL